MTEQSGLIFISYTRSDEAIAVDLYQRLERDGYLPWLDRETILAGQDWEREINIALAHATIVLVLVSEHSVDHRGIVQKELRLALDAAKAKLLDDIFLIPLVLTRNVKVPDELAKPHYLSLEDPDWYTALCRAIDFQLDRLGKPKITIDEDTGVTWSFEAVEEEWDGTPGYDVKYSVPRLRSKEYGRQLDEISIIIRADQIEATMGERRGMLDQAGSHFQRTASKFSRTNTYEAMGSEVRVVGRAMSIVYEVYWYGAGAAHPNGGVSVYNFLLRPLIRVGTAAELFLESEKDTALKNIQDRVRQSLRDEMIAGLEGESPDMEWVERGTADWSDFATFAFGRDSITFYFSPYQVASYASGQFAVEVAYPAIQKLMKMEYRAALNIQHDPWDER